ncbi:MAG: sulfotransferase domain-containing protein [Candidatus Pacearchaeota archaeon]|nr:sulfotransferase domain-containing protein [Candidatus Pacearchaeota archaeon]
MRLDFLGVGFGRSGSYWLVNCLNEHPEISIPKFSLLTEINYFPEEYKVMGLKNYMNKFKNCDFTKRVGELSTLIIFHKDSAKLLKKLFPSTKIIIYQRNEDDRMKSSYTVAKHIDLVEDNSLSLNPTYRINQEEYIRPFIKEFGKKQVHIFNLDNKNRQEELNRLFDFIGVSHFVPEGIDRIYNPEHIDKEGKIPRGTKFKPLRKTINFFKLRLRKNKKLFYTLKRNFKMDYIYQNFNHFLVEKPRFTKASEYKYSGHLGAK